MIIGIFMHVLFKYVQLTSGFVRVYLCYIREDNIISYVLFRLLLLIQGVTVSYTGIYSHKRHCSGHYTSLGSTEVSTHYYLKQYK